jgi:hypothetical protein
VWAETTLPLPPINKVDWITNINGLIKYKKKRKTDGPEVGGNMIIFKTHEHWNL